MFKRELKNFSVTFLVLVSLIISGFNLYLYHNLSEKTQTTKTANVLKTQSSTDKPSSEDPNLAKAKLAMTLADSVFKEEVEYLSKYGSWPTYTSNLGIKFKYPQGLGCGSSKWEIKEEGNSVLIYSCQRFAGTFSTLAPYEITKVSLQEYSNVGSYKLIYGLHVILGGPWYEANDELLDGIFKFLPYQIHLIDQGNFSYFKFILRGDYRQRSDLAIISKMVNSVELK